MIRNFTKKKIKKICLSIIVYWCVVHNMTLTVYCKMKIKCNFIFYSLLTCLLALQDGTLVSGTERSSQSEGGGWKKLTWAIAVTRLCRSRLSCLILLMRACSELNFSSFFLRNVSRLSESQSYFGSVASSRLLVIAVSSGPTSSAFAKIYI